MSENRVDGLLFSAASDRSMALDVLDADRRAVRARQPRGGRGAARRSCWTRSQASRRRSRCLADAGHTRIAYVSGPPDIDTARRRKSGFLKAMKQLGLAVDERLVMSAFEPETAQAATLAMLDVDPPPTAICAWTIKSALGVLHALHEQSVPIPEATSR